MRLFIAVPLPAQRIADLDRVVQVIRPRLPAASWTRAEAQHLTLAFLGEQEAGTVGAIDKQLRRALATASPFEARLSGCGFFPDERRPRVAWIGLDLPEPLAELAATVHRTLAAAVAFDQKPFRPHLTLARIKERWGLEDVQRLKSTLGAYRSEPFRVSEVVLYSSELSPGGARHTALLRLALGDRSGY